MNRSPFLCVLLTACAVDPAPGEDPIDEVQDVPPVAGDEGIAPPPVHASVRKVTIDCGQDFQGNDLVHVSAVSDLNVRLALASFHRAGDSDAVELDRRIPEPLVFDGLTIFSKTSLRNSGRFSPDATSPVHCATIADFAVKVIVAFEDGTVGCTLAGNAAEAAKLRCED